MNTSFSDEALSQYIDWQKTDRKISDKINILIIDIKRNGLMKGIGHPEKLKGRPEYSRHITDEHRLVYKMDKNGSLVIVSCKGHYID